MKPCEIRKGVNYHDGKKNYRGGMTKYASRRYVDEIDENLVVYRKKNGDGLTKKQYFQSLTKFAEWAKGEY